MYIPTARMPLIERREGLVLVAAELRDVYHVTRDTRIADSKIR